MRGIADMWKKHLGLFLTLVFALVLSSCGYPTFNLDEIVLKDVVPSFKTDKGEIHTNTEEELWIDVYNISEEQYIDYVKLCKDNGFIVDPEEDSISYDAYNDDGYKLELLYNSDETELSLNLYAPMQMKKLKWPEEGVAASLPIPKSKVGVIEWEHSDSFLIYVGETSIDDYRDYVDSCISTGFDIDYSRGDDYYNAENASGYSLSVYYEGNNIMSVRVDLFEDISDENEYSVSNDSTTKQTKPESDNENISFAEIYRAYQENELNADDVYGGNRYRITATVREIDSDGIWTLNGLLGGAMLTMENEVDGINIVFKAEFNKDQEDDLKTISVGDTIVFEGECSSAGLWTECKIVND